MKPLIFKYYYTLLIVLFALTACKKDEFINLTATLSSDSTLLETTEDTPIIFNLELTEKLSEDLQIEYEIDTEEINKYINSEDFESYVEYISDLGDQWSRSNFNPAGINTLIFPKGSRILKIRIPFFDDDSLEYNEEFYLKVRAKPSYGLTIMGEIEPIMVTVEDNEENIDIGALVGEPIDDLEEAFEGALVAIDEDFNFKVVAINRKENIDREYKAAYELLDERSTHQIKKDIQAVSQSGEVPISMINLFYENEPLFGFVENMGDLYEEDLWLMGLNFYWAFNAFEDFDDYNNDSTIPIEYNADGAFGAALVHEYGHILTLNSKNELNRRVYNPAECSSLFSYEDGCFYKESVLNQFNANFYLIEEALNKPEFVSWYAETDIFEDIAETFTVYVLEEKINPATAESSGALQKINFLKSHPTVKDKRSLIRSTLGNPTLPPFGFEDLSAFNKRRKGKPISCLHQRFSKHFTSK